MPPETKRRKLSNSVYEASPAQDEERVAPVTVPNSDEPKTEQRRSLFIRSLPASVTTERLTEHFSQSFPLKHATVVLDPATKASRGFGFVTFTDAEDAQAALEQFDKSVLDGRKIRVEAAESRNREIGEDITGARKETKNLKGEELRAQRQKNLEENRPPKLIVRNLPWSVNDSDALTKLFMSYGKVKHAVVPKLKDDQSAGFGFVVMRGKKNAERALEAVNGKEVDGRTLAVDWAVEKEAWEKLQAAETNPKDGQPIDGDATETKSADDKKADIDQPMHVELESDAESDHDDGESALESDAEEAIMNSDPDMDDAELSDNVDTPSNPEKEDQNSTTIFIRNLPFTTDDETLQSHFKTHFGAVRYARVVYDRETERSRGTGFVCFFNEADAKDCVKNAPRRESVMGQSNGEKPHRGDVLKHSLLQDETADPSGRYTMEDRVLQVSRALDKTDADRRMKESSMKRDHDKRRLYLLSEGTIPKGSKLYSLLGKAEIDIRESSARQRQKLVKTNPNLGLSLTRLSIRNVPRSLTSKDLKALAREAVVGFARDVKEAKRQSLSREELQRGGEIDREAERERKRKGVGIVKQVKIVFESQNSGSKVGEGKGGRSRGYGFIEYYGHRNALMGLRWLNGHLVKPKNADEDRGKRLIVEFAIENAQVVQRREDRENRVRQGDFQHDRRDNRRDFSDRRRDVSNDKRGFSNGRKDFSAQRRDPSDRKRKRDGADGSGERRPGKRQQTGDQKNRPAKPELGEDERNKIAMRNRIIAKGRQKRKMRNGKS